MAQKYQGYGGLLHGGIAGTMLDSVMTHCLMQRGIKGLTAELNIKYHKPIEVGSIVSIYGKINKKLRKVYFLSAYLETEQGICVSAHGKFIEPKK
ncbi:PaaI family thioesterase [Vibrio salinus]|uniref:PaaI family thioesterase n=1 Tax=Vibrio salinus TaxID=2899784 RepID=UPI001E28E83E|nr:PaaI family thioesterase [Vibrio salinus]MCE0492581.1 PaaI family thioesterase [Vibrio salinus]